MLSFRLSLLLSVIFKSIYVKAQFIDDGSNWLAPPLESADLGVTVLLFIVTFVQLIILLSYLCRGRASHMAPAAFVIANAFFLLLSYLLGIVSLVIRFTVWGLDLPRKTHLSVSTAESLFSLWADPAMIIAVALIIRDRYVAHHQKDGNVLLRFIAPAVLGFLALLVFIFGCAYGGLLNKDPDTLKAAISQAKAITAVDHARVSFFLVATIATLGYGIYAKISIASDMILNVTLFGILPVHILGAIASVVSSVYFAKLNAIPQTEFVNGPAFDFAFTLVFGVLYIIILCILCYFYLNPPYWDRPSQNGGQTSVAVGTMPIAQFPGQWGNTGQPQQIYGGPAQPYYGGQPQQYVTVQPQQFHGQPPLAYGPNQSYPPVQPAMVPQTRDQSSPPPAQQQTMQDGAVTSST